MIRYTESDGLWRAHADVVVGIEHIDLSVGLGALEHRPPVGGLLHTPVVTVASGAAALVTAGARRAGKEPTILTVPGADPTVAGSFLVAAREGAEVIVVEDGDAHTLTAARILDGQPIPALPLDTPEAVAALLGALTIDVNLPVPTGGSSDRAAANAILEPLEPERIHHLVEVDPRPAFDELGWDPAKASLGDRAAAAAGVLAGRLAAGNRRWRG